MYEKLSEKLEKGTKRKEGQIQQVKEKAAAANLNAKSIAHRVNSIRNPSELTLSNEPIHDEPKYSDKTQRSASPCLNTKLVGEPSDEKLMSPKKADKRRLKKIRQRAQASAEIYMFHPQVGLPEPSQRNKDLKKRMLRLVQMLKSHQGSSSRPIDSASIEQEVSIICARFEDVPGEPNTICDETLVDYTNLCTYSVLKTIVSCCLTVQDSHHGNGNNSSSIHFVYSPNLVQKALRIVILSLKYRSICEMMLRSSDLLLISVVESLSKILPNCWPNVAPLTVAANSSSAVSAAVASPDTANADDGNVYLCVASQLCSIITRCLLYESQTASSTASVIESLQEDLVRVILSSRIVDKLRAVYLVTHGPLGGDTAFVAFLKESCLLLDTMTSTRHKRQETERPYYDSKPVKPYEMALVSVFRNTELGGLVTMLDSVLLYKGGTSRAAVEEELHCDLVSISHTVLRTLNNLCALDLGMVQVI